MTNRQFSPQTYLAIKAAFRDLVTAAGGPKRAADKTRGCQSRISEAMAPHEDERFPAIDQVADLEGETGQLHITRLLADMAGFDLVPRVTSARPRTMLADAAAMGIAYADMHAKFLMAMADGALDPVERTQLRAALNETRRLLNDFDAQLAVANTVRAVNS